MKKNISFKVNYDFDRLVLNTLLLSDGKSDVLKISKILNEKILNILKVSELLKKAKLLKCIS